MQGHPIQYGRRVSCGLVSLFQSSAACCYPVIIHRRGKAVVCAGVAVAAAVFALGIGGCAQGTKRATRDATRQPVDGASLDQADAAAVPSAEPIRAFPDCAIEAQVPPGLNAQGVAPLQGDELARARWPLAKVRDGLPEAALDAPGDAEAAPDGDPEVPLATQRLYAAARQQMLEGRNADAVRLLETALRVSPSDPQLLRLLGAGWATLGNRVRSMQYLRQAVAANPDDLQSLVTLGRFQVEAGQSDAGLSLLLAALDREDELAKADPALPWLTRFYLSAGLRQAGYLGASVEQLRAFLNGPRDGLRPTRYGAELVFVDRQRAAHAVVLGDLHSRLGDALLARQAYAASEQAGGGGAELARRIVYTDLRLGRLDQASERIVELVNDSDGSPAALSLVEYAIAQGLPAEPVVAALRASLLDAEGPEAVTLALASAMPRDAAIALLSQHLDAAPADARVYERLVGLLAGAEGTDAQRVQAIRRAADAMEQEPALAVRRAGALLALSPGLEPLLSAFEALDATQKERAAVLTLEAIVRYENGQPAEASALLDRVLTRPDAPPLARVEKARLLALRGDYTGAEAVLAELSPDLNELDDPRLGQLRVGILVNLNRWPEALQLLGSLIAQHPEDVRFVLEKARLLVTMDRVAEGEQTLLDAINRAPRQELYYAELLKLYDTVGSKLENNEQAYIRLMQGMRRHIPNSRTFQLALAGLLEVRGDFDQAEAILNGLLQRNADDVDAKLVLLDVLHKTGREEKATELIEQVLTLAPGNAEVLDAARTHFQRTGNQDRQLQVEEAWLRTKPPGLARDVRLATILAKAQRWPEALDFLDSSLTLAKPEQHLGVVGALLVVVLESPFDVAEPRLRRIAEDPGIEFDARKEMGILLGSRYSQQEQHEAFDALMQALLKEAPEDPDLNNHLGYSWAHAGRNLEEAERMIGVAVAAQPNQAAYLDSMGWVLYKRGKFVEAEAWLRRAIAAPNGENAVLFDHLGDALYQQGKPDEAQAQWAKAQTMMERIDHRNDPDPETATIVKRTTAKLEALAQGDAGRPVPVAPAAADPAPGSLGTEPTTGQNPAGK